MSNSKRKTFNHHRRMSNLKRRRMTMNIKL
jgi:hypothetical protein